MAAQVSSLSCRNNIRHASQVTPEPRKCRTWGVCKPCACAAGPSHSTGQGNFVDEGQTGRIASCIL